MRGGHGVDGIRAEFTLCFLDSETSPVVRTVGLRHGGGRGKAIYLDQGVVRPLRKEAESGSCSYRGASE